MQKTIRKFQEMVEPVLLFTEEVNFYDMKKDKIYTRQLVSKK